MKIFGHRGAAGLVLENTVASIRKALEWKVDGIEFDVRATKDGKPAIIHDETLERTHKVKRKVSDLTMSQIRELTKEHRYPVPNLSQVMRAIGKKVPANVELKERAAVAPALRTLNELVEAKLVEPDKILITSFDHDAVALFREHTERYKLGLLTGKLPGEAYWKLARSLNVFSVNISKKVVNQQFVKRAHADGREVMVYTVNDPAEADKLASIGVNAVFTDVPDKIRSSRAPG